MKVEVNVPRTWAYVVLVALLLGSGTFAVLAAVPYISTSQPNPGHGGTTVWVDVAGTEMTLQDAITQGKIGGGGSGGSSNIVFISPVVIENSLTTSKTWTTYDTVSRGVPTGASAVILEAEFVVDGPNDANTHSYVKIRKDSSSSVYLLSHGQAYGSGDGVADASQGIFPLSSTGTFDYDISSFNKWVTIRLIGYVTSGGSGGTSGGSGTSGGWGNMKVYEDDGVWPPSGVTVPAGTPIMVEVWGGGGGGSCVSGTIGGGGGAYGRGVYTLASVASNGAYSVVVGAGGSSIYNSVAAVNGELSSVNGPSIAISAGGGETGGTASAQNTGIAKGGTSAAPFNIAGQDGLHSFSAMQGGSGANGGSGGFRGQSPGGGIMSTVAQSPGGGAACGATESDAIGASGRVVIWW